MVSNPFESIQERLDSIESLLNDLKNAPRQESPPPPPELLTVEEAANFLKLTVPTIYSKVSRGELPVMKRTKRLYFDRDQLTAYIREGQKMTNQEAESQADKYVK